MHLVVFSLARDRSYITGVLPMQKILLYHNAIDSYIIACVRRRRWVMLFYCYHFFLKYQI